MLLVVLVAFTFSCGGQWAILQTLAWANMIREYSEVVPVTEAIQMTFSGKYPCSMCKAIAEKNQSENTKMATIFQPEKKIVTSGLSVAARAVIISSQTFFSRDSFFQTRSEAPPTPPPRFA